MEDKIVINGETYIKESSLIIDIEDRVSLKLISLLESIDEKTATPEMLEASASIAEKLLKFY